MGAGTVALLLVPVALASWVARMVVVVTLSGRAPRVARFVDTWWAWAPLGAVIVALALAHPILGVLAAVASYLFLASDRAIGSPFRPRR